MGCGISKNANALVKSVDVAHHQEHKDDDELEIQVIQEAKPVKKGQFDDMPLHLSIDKNAEKPNEKIPQGLPVKITKIEEVLAEGKSTEENKAPHVLKEELHKKSKTMGNISFENHPHTFDFDYIDEPHKSKNEDDLVTDQIYKEISEI